MRDIPLILIRDHLDDLPVYDCPPAFHVRSFQEGDEEAWFRIEAAAGAFPDEARARAQFAREFSPVQERLPGRMLFLEHETAGPIGTTMAWAGEFAGAWRGRIHWVGIMPAWQGRGLAKPLLSTAVHRLAAEHFSAYITTETTSYRGINLYLGFGFRPWIESDRDRDGWAIVSEALGRPIP